MIPPLSHELRIISCMEISRDPRCLLTSVFWLEDGKQRVGYAGWDSCWDLLGSDGIFAGSTSRSLGSLGRWHGRLANVILLQIQYNSMLSMLRWNRIKGPKSKVPFFDPQQPHNIPQPWSGKQMPTNPADRELLFRGIHPTRHVQEASGRASRRCDLMWVLTSHLCMVGIQEPKKNI